jgi:hypothetical protein
MTISWRGSGACTTRRRSTPGGGRGPPSTARRSSPHSEEQRRADWPRRRPRRRTFRDPIVTEITPAGPYYEAEDYHQDYYRQNRSQGYCRMVIAPKLGSSGLEKSVLARRAGGALRCAPAPRVPMVARRRRALARATSSQGEGHERAPVVRSRRRQRRGPRAWTQRAQAQETPAAPQVPATLGARRGARRARPRRRLAARGAGRGGRLRARRLRQRPGVRVLESRPTYNRQVAGQALACMALMRVDETPAVRAALEKGLRRLSARRDSKARQRVGLGLHRGGPLRLRGLRHGGARRALPGRRVARAGGGRRAALSSGSWSATRQPEGAGATTTSPILRTAEVGDELLHRAGPAGAPSRGSSSDG